MRKETLLARGLGDKIPPCCKRCSSPARRRHAASFRETHLAAYRFMLLARLLDDKFAALYRAGKIHGGVFLGRGQEALSAAIGVSLKKGDVFAPLIRDAAGRLAFGETDLDAVRTYLGSALGPMRGRDGNVHRGRPQRRLSADDQPSRRDDFRRERHAVRAPLERNFRHRRRGVPRRRRDLHRRVSRSAESGRRRKTAARPRRRQQSIRLFHADFAPVRLRTISRTRPSATASQSHSVDGTDLSACLKIVGERGRPRARRPRPATRRRQTAPPLRPRRTRRRQLHRPEIEKFPARPRLPESRRGISAPTKMGRRRAARRLAQRGHPRNRGSRRAGPARTGARSVRGKLGGDFLRTLDERESHDECDEMAN